MRDISYIMLTMEYNGHKIWKLQILWGKQYGVIFIPSPQKLLIIRDEILILSMPENTTETEKNSFLMNKMKEFLKAEIELLLPKWEQITGLKCSSWFIGKNKSAWGWCKPSKARIMLNENLIYKPKECLEYVILHELCHLKQGNHGKMFAELLNRYMPNWRDFEVLSNGGIPRYGK